MAMLRSMDGPAERDQDDDAMARDPSVG